MAEEVAITPSPFQGFWLHKTDVGPEIRSNGWNPLLNRGSIYGTAVYLSRQRWETDDTDLLGFRSSSNPDLETITQVLREPDALVCVLALRESEVQTCFPSLDEPEGRTVVDLLAYLSVNVPRDSSAPGGFSRVNKDGGPSTSLQFGRNPGPGNNRQNLRIANYFINKGVKAIQFFEHDLDVVAVFDPSCIRVVTEGTDFKASPFLAW